MLRPEQKKLTDKLLSQDMDKEFFRECADEIKRLQAAWDRCFNQIMFNAQTSSRTIQEANAELDKMGDDVYCKAEAGYYGKPLAIHIEGHFSPEDLMKVALISGGIETKVAKSLRGKL